jgi:hypothetical protein
LPKAWILAGSTANTWTVALVVNASPARAIVSAPTVGAVATILDEVVRTATQVLEGSRSAREAVTILATLTREAEKAAGDLRRSEPERAVTYRDLVLTIVTELRRREAANDEPPQVRAVVDDLGRLVKALE